jgi:hypothetical protein
MLGVVALALVLSAFTWWPMLSAYPHTQIWEGPFMQEMLEAARVSMVRYHELPLWNPYQCGGVPLWDNPQGMGAAPLFWPLAAFTADTTRAMELWYVLHVALGFVSLWLLARLELGLTWQATIVACCMWAFSGTHTQHFTGAGFQWTGAFYIPLAVFLWRRAERDWRMAIGLGLVVALQFWAGAIYPVMFTTLTLAGETATRLVTPSRIKPIARAGAIAVLAMLALSAGRLIPVVYQAMTHKRPLGIETDALEWSTLRAMYLDRDHARFVPGQMYVWPEYADYVGPFLLGLSILGIAVGVADYPWVAGGLAWVFLIMLGHKWSWAPWHVLKNHVYPFKDMRVPSRFNVPVNMFLALFAGIGVDRLAMIARRLSFRPHAAQAVRTVGIVLGLVGAGDMISLGYPVIASSYIGPPLDRDVAVSPRLFLEGAPMASFVDQPQQNRGRFDCWEEWAFGAGAGYWRGDVPQARTTTAGATVLNVIRTQNTFLAEVDSTQPAHVQFNTAFDLGWRASEGQVVDDARVLAVDVPPGHHTLRVKYWPRGLTLGLLITITSVVAIAALLVVDARRRRRLGEPSTPDASKATPRPAHEAA